MFELMKFQFHKVQLKVAEYASSHMTNAKFQFHKVQLKVSRELCEYKFTFVSIP